MNIKLLFLVFIFSFHCMASEKNVYTGMYVYKAEAETFSPCDGGRIYRLIGSEKLLNKLRQKYKASLMKAREGMYVLLQGNFTTPQQKTVSSFDNRASFKITKILNAPPGKCLKNEVQENLYFKNKNNAWSTIFAKSPKKPKDLNKDNTVFEQSPKNKINLWSSSIQSPYIGLEKNSSLESLTLKKCVNCESLVKKLSNLYLKTNPSVVCEDDKLLKYETKNVIAYQMLTYDNIFYIGLKIGGKGIENQLAQCGIDLSLNQKTVYYRVDGDRIVNLMDKIEKEYHLENDGMRELNFLYLLRNKVTQDKVEVFFENAYNYDGYLLHTHKNILRKGWTSN